MTSQLPEQFGRYRILKTLGQGGMGAVYLAHDTQLQRKVALKVPRIDADDGPGVLQRFYREARSAATLNHPNICPVYDVGSQDDIPYLTMAYVEGGTLAAMIENGEPLPERAAIRIVATLAQALQEAHTRGVIHRDLKPSNVMMNQRNEPVVMDFGLARQTNRHAARQTNAGAIMGTPAYMPPEQVRGEVEAVGPGCDIYSLGVILYELLTGRLPFEGPVAAVLGQILTQEPQPPSAYRPDLDARLEAVCVRAMHKKMAARFTSMSDMAWALNDCLRPAALPVATAPPKKKAQIIALAKPARLRETSPIQPRPATRRAAPPEKAAQTGGVKRRKDTVPIPVAAPRRSAGYRLIHSCVSIVAIVTVLAGLAAASLFGYVIWTGSRPDWLPANNAIVDKPMTKDGKPPPPKTDKDKADDDGDLKPLNVVFEGSLTDQNDRDAERKYYKAYPFKAEKGKTYRIELTGKGGFDPCARVEDTTGKILKREDFGDGKMSRVFFSATQAGTYHAIAGAFNADRTGDFTLSVNQIEVKEAKAQALSFGDGKAVAVSELTAEDAKILAGDKHYKDYTFEGESGKTYRIDLHSKDFDAYLYLKDSAGKILMENDDNGESLDSRIVWTVEQTGTYHIIATTLGPGRTGRFVLTVAESSGN